MEIVVLGGGRIGSVFAFRLALAGHAVTVVARGPRLDALRGEAAIVTTDGQRAPVRVAEMLDPTAPYDLVIVTVPEHQIAPFVPQLAHSAAKTILLMFNTFHGPKRYRTAIGAERVTAGFPNMIAFLEKQRLRYKVDGPGMVTTLSDPNLAGVLKSAGLPTELESDMESFLRTHVVMVLPFFLAALWTWKRKDALTWSEARRLSRAWPEGFKSIKRLGNALRPRLVAALHRMPSTLSALVLWLASRSAAVRDLGEFGPAETRWLIDSLAEWAPGQTPQLLSMRP